MSEQPIDLEDMLARASADGGWGLLDELEKRFGASPEVRKMREYDKEQRRALGEAANRIFSGKEGEMVLDWLLDQTWRRLAFAVMSCETVEKSTLYGAFREGQNALALSIFQLIAAGRGEPPPPQKE